MGEFRDLLVFDSAAAGDRRDQVRQILADALPHATVRGVVAGEDILPDIERAIVSGYDRIIVAGGDPTITAAAEAMLYSGMPLGIVPLGPRNLFATQLGISDDPEQACELLLGGGSVHEISVMNVDGRLILTDLRIGAPRAAKWGVGKSWPIRLRIDGTLHRAVGSLLLLEHSRGGSRSKTRLKLGVLRRRSLGQAVRAIGRLPLSRPAFPPAFEAFEVKRELWIETGSPIPIEGYAVRGRRNSIRIENLPGALRVITPAGVAARRAAASGPNDATERLARPPGW